MINTALLVHSGDKAEWVFPYFYHFWKKYWTCSDIVDTVVLTENSTWFDNKPGIVSEKTGEKTWACGIIDYLLRSKYQNIIYIHEDYFFTEPTNINKLDDLLHVFSGLNMSLLKMCGWWAGYIDDQNPHFRTDLKMWLTVDEDLSEIWQYNNNCPYLISHQTSIWKREFLLSTLLPSMTPWDHELAGTEMLRKRNIPIHAYRGKSPLEYAEAVNRGQKRENALHLFNEVDNAI